jgi:hypothetical protein
MAVGESVDTPKRAGCLRRTNHEMATTVSIGELRCAGCDYGGSDRLLLFVATRRRGEIVDLGTRRLQQEVRQP